MTTKKETEENILKEVFNKWEKEIGAEKWSVWDYLETPQIIRFGEMCFEAGKKEAEKENSCFKELQTYKDIYERELSLRRDIEKKLAEKDKEIERLEQQLSKEDSKGWLDVSDVLGEPIEVEIEVHDKDKSWNELKISEREKELLTSEQCIKLANSKYAKILKMDGSSEHDDFFIQQPFNLNRENGRVAWFDVGSDGADLYCRDDPDYSYSTLGVRFARKISEKKTEGEEGK